MNSNNIKFTKRFYKSFKKLPNNDKKSFASKLKLFIENSNDPSLNNHKLKGILSDYWSFSTRYDFRCIFKIIDGKIEIYNIGSHFEVY